MKVDPNEATARTAMIETTLGLVQWPKCCLQAGGARGVYPLALSLYFDQVVTCEPYPETWNLLLQAIDQTPNIIAHNVALSDVPGRGKMVDFRPGKPLTAYLDVTGNDFDVVTVDSLEIEPQLIWFDLQGSEYKALLGAKRTLKTCEVVIIEEDGKGLEPCCGTIPGSARKLLEQSGFEMIERHRFDVLFARHHGA